MLSILGCSILTAVLVGGVSLYEGRIYIRTEAEEKLIRTAEAHANQISQILESTESTTAALHSFIIDSIDSQAFISSNSYRDHYEQIIDNYISRLCRRNEHAIGLYVTFNPELTSRIYEIWYADLTNNGILQRVDSELYSQYMVVDEEWIYPEPSLFTPDQEGMDYLYEPMVQKKPIWFDPYVEIGLNLTALSYVEPIIKNGVTLGVTGMDVDIENIKQKILDMQVYQNGYAFLLNGDREVVIHPFENQALHFQDLQLVNIDELTYKLKKSSSGTLFSQDGKNLLSFATLSNGWILVLVPPYQEIMHPIFSLSAMIIIMTFLAILIAFLAAYQLSYRFSGSINAAATQLHFMELGDFTKEIPEELLKRDDDLGHFIKSVHSMQQIIKGLIFQLEPEEGLFKQTFFQTQYATNRAAIAIEQLAIAADNKEENLKHALEKLSVMNEGLHEQVQKELHKNRQKDAAFLYYSRQAKMGEMVANIAHQWRQPLNNLNLGLRNLKDSYISGELDPEEFFQRISRADMIISNLSRTIDDFQNFLKPARIKEEFSLLNQTRFAVEIMEESLRSREIRIGWGEADKLMVTGFANEYVHVITNLLSNSADALQAIPGREREIIIQIGKNGEDAVISIENTGPVITDDIAKKIFTVHFSTKGERQGTGIGLYMSKVIIEEHFQGNISFNNTERGVVWILRLPLR